MELQSFLAALEERIARYDLLCHPYYKAWTAGQLTRDDLREYASDYYQHVAAFPAYLSALHSRLDDGAQRRAVLRNLCEEEIEGRPHSELWLDFAEGMGADRGPVREREPLPEVHELIGEFRRVAREGSTAEALAAFYAYESQVPRVAKARPTAWPSAMAPTRRRAAISRCIGLPTWNMRRCGTSCWRRKWWHIPGRRKLRYTRRKLRRRRCGTRWMGWKPGEWRQCSSSLPPFRNSSDKDGAPAV